MNAMNDFQLDRRKLLVGGVAALGGMALFSGAAEGKVRVFVPSTDDKRELKGRTLILLQLTGGHDALSMVVPYGDDAYGRNRTTTRVDAKDVLRIDHYQGLHPALAKLKGIYDDGRLAIVEGCGYPHPIRSHFKSMEVWHTGQEIGRQAGEGWIGRLCDAAWGKDETAELIVHIGPNTPYSVYSPKHAALSFQTPASYKWVATDGDDGDMYKKAGETNEKPKGQAKVLEHLRGVLNDAQDSSIKVRRAVADYKPRKEYPDEELAQTLRVVAALVQADVGSRVISIELGGFDTHNNQKNRHDALMRRLDAALPVFLDDIKGTPGGDNTIVLAFSEFGRRLHENGSGGTDHGVAAPMFVAGTRVKGGLYGKHPSLDNLDDGDLIHTTDFRSVYGTVIEKWFGADQTKVLDAHYPLIPMLKA
jgi:uncharacterized protein (DUF1501 family)